MTYLYTYILFLHENILFYFEEKITFIRDKNKIEDFEREREIKIVRERKGEKISQCWRMRHGEYFLPHY